MKTITKSDGNEELLEDFSAHGIVVPTGFTWDGASTPRLLWFIIPPMWRTKKASCIHDWLCKNATCDADRLYADKLFRIMLREEGLSEARCYLGYLGVRIGAHLGIGVYYER